MLFYRNIFSPTESIESSGTASVKTVEFIPVKEKIKMIAAQQEELMRKEEASKSQGSSQAESKQKGVRILPPSPVTVRKMMVEEELQHYDTAVTRTTPTVEMMDSRMNTLERRQQVRDELSVTPLSMVSGVSVPGWNTPQDILEQCKQKYEVDQAFEQLVAESSSQQTSSMVQSSQVQSSSMMTSSSKTMTAAEECRRSFEQAELEAMALDSSSCASYSKQSSMVDTQSVQSFVYQSGTTVQQQQSQQQQTKQQSEQTQQNHVTQKQQVSYSKQQRSNSAASFERSNSRNSNNSDDISRSRKTLRCGGKRSNLTRKFIRMHPRRRVYIRFSFNLNVGLASAFLICIRHEKLLSSICHLCIFLQDEFHVKSFFSILLLNFNFLVCINFKIQNRLHVFTLHNTVLNHCLADISGLG